MKKYRFKTHEEFNKMYGDGWRDSLGHWFSPGMDFLFGSNLTSEENSSAILCLETEQHGFSLSRQEKDSGRFSISLDMLVEMGVGGTISIPREKRYRIKTISEFKQGRGTEDWQSRQHWNHEGRMDYLLGKVLTDEENVRARRVVEERGEHSFNLDEWTIYSNMLKEITFNSYTTLNENLIKGSKKILLNQNN
jgi:hypothetical protein